MLWVCPIPGRRATRFALGYFIERLQRSCLSHLVLEFGMSFEKAASPEHVASWLHRFIFCASSREVGEIIFFCDLDCYVDTIIFNDSVDERTNVSGLFITYNPSKQIQSAVKPAHSKLPLHIPPHVQQQINSRPQRVGAVFIQA